MLWKQNSVSRPRFKKTTLGKVKLFQSLIYHPLGKDSDDTFYFKCTIFKIVHKNSKDAFNLKVFILTRIRSPPSRYWLYLMITFIIICRTSRLSSPWTTWPSTWSTVRTVSGGARTCSTSMCRQSSRQETRRMLQRNSICQGSRPEGVLYRIRKIHSAKTHQFKDYCCLLTVCCSWKKYLS